MSYLLLECKGQGCGLPNPDPDPALFFRVRYGVRHASGGDENHAPIPGRSVPAPTRCVLAPTRSVPVVQLGPWLSNPAREGWWHRTDMGSEPRLGARAGVNRIRQRSPACGVVGSPCPVAPRTLGGWPSLHPVTPGR